MSKDIHDQTYQFFIEEVPELLQAIETGLLTIRQDHSTSKVHEIMRAAHSIKGGAATVGLETIKTLAHRLEDFFKALYKQDITIDKELENLFLQAYDCVRIPLSEQIKTGNFDSLAALNTAEPIFAQIEEKLGDALNAADDYIPSSSDLGIDIASSIFEIDVAQGIEHLQTVAANPAEYDIASEITSQAEIFSGFAELLNLPGFAAIGQRAIEALSLNPSSAQKIALIMAADCASAREAVLAGDRTSGGQPSAELEQLASSSPTTKLPVANSNNPIIYDQAYQFFIEEAPELLQAIETGLLTIREDKSPSKVHEIMRAAHSIKGGAATVGLETIKTLAHRLEDFFKALHLEENIDVELETLLLQGYDCLRLPLSEQIKTGNFDSLAALNTAEPIFAQIEEKLGDALNAADDYIPSSSDLGIDIASSIFEIDVAQGIEHLQTVAANPAEYDIASEITSQAEIFSGFAELLNLPGFAAIGQRAIEALSLNPSSAQKIALIMAADCASAREAVLAGDRTSGGQPSAELEQLASSSPTTKLPVANSNNPIIYDQAYQFFIEEAPELLQAIETGLLTIREDKSPSKVHEIMRAAHSIKGGAATVGLETIKTLAHRLEDFFKALHLEENIDVELETLLLQGYDCLRLPLSEQIKTGNFDEKAAIEISEPIFAQIEEKLKEALTRSEDYIPSSTDLGVDIVSSIFEVDVAQELERLTAVVANPADYEVAGEVRALIDVFAGFGELLNLPGFTKIAQVGKSALENYPDKDLQIAQLLLADFVKSREQVLAGDRTLGGTPSQALLELAQNKTDLELSESKEQELEELLDLEEIPSLDFVFGENALSFDSNEIIIETEAALDEEIPSLDELLFGSEATPLEIELIETESLEESPSLEQVFGEVAQSEQNQIESLDELFKPQEIETDLLDESVPIEQVFGEIGLSELQDSNGLISDPVGDLASIEEVFLGGEKHQLDLELAKEIGSLEENTPTLEEVFANPISNKLSWQSKETLEQEPTPEEILDLDQVFGNQQIDDLAALGFEENTPTLEDIFNPSLLEEIIDAEAANQDSEIEIIEEIFATKQNHELIEEDLPINESSELSEKPPTLEDVFGNLVELSEPTNAQTSNLSNGSVQGQQTSENLEIAVQTIEQIFDELPTASEVNHAQSKKITHSGQTSKSQLTPSAKPKKVEDKSKISLTPANLSVRVDLLRLETMNNLVGELSINRNSLSLQNDQLQATVKELINKFARFQQMSQKLREISDQMLVSSLSYSYRASSDFSQAEFSTQVQEAKTFRSDFDSLEMDSYGMINSMLQGLLEEIIQLEEAVDDVVLFARQSDQSLEQQRQMLTRLRDELMWARMLPLGEVLNRFPRMLRDLSSMYHKPVNLKITGTGVLVDKAALEKLYDPLLHIVRNAFDHGIEPPDVRRQKGKPEEGKIEIKAYHKGNQTVIEISDDGQGLNLEKIGQKALELGLLSQEQLAVTSKASLLELIFEPGFSTATKVSELSGRGMGLDVVRSQLRILKGTISVNSSPEEGTSFILRLPLTLTLAKLIVCLIGSSALAMPSDSIEEIIIPTSGQIRITGKQRFLYINQQVVPIYSLTDLLTYNCPYSQNFTSKALSTVAMPSDWALPLLLLRRGQQLFALEVERLVTEQELVIKPFGSAIAAPPYTYGCTIIGDGTLIPVINATILVEQVLEPSSNISPTPSLSLTSSSIAPHHSKKTDSIRTSQAQTVLIIDDSAAMRRTLALSLEKAGYRVIQARDGKEGLEQLQPNEFVKLVICDVEMPNMNGFEFLGQRRRNTQFLKIPVAMLTSRSNDKHRRLAMQLGANAYFTKPYIEQDFIAAINKMIGQNVSQSLTTP